MARSSDDPRLCFKALYHDELSGLTREFQLRFYFNDKSVELTDLNTRKSFLKRTDCPNLDTCDFVLGKTVVVFGRLLRLIEYMDTVTRQLCEGVSAQTASPSYSVTAAGGGTVIGGSAHGATTADRAQQQQQQQCGTCYVFVERAKYFDTIGKVLSVLDVELGFTVTGITSGTLPSAAVAAALQSLAEDPSQVVASDGNDAASNLKALSGKMLCCFRLAKAGCNASIGEVYRRLVTAERVVVTSLPPAARVGLYAVATPTTTSVIESLFDAIAARAAAKYVSGSAATGSVVLLKPHLLLNRSAGDVLQVLLEQSGGELVGLSLINLSSRDATSLLAAYRGVLPDFQGTTSQLASGSAIAVHLCSRGTAAVLAAEDAYRDGCAAEINGAHHARGDASSDSDIFTTVRAVCGPYDPTIAKALRGATIRARYGIDRSRNAVHCCDIEEDVVGMCRFVFAFVAVRKLMKPSSECS